MSNINIINNLIDTQQSYKKEKKKENTTNTTIKDMITTIKVEGGHLFVLRTYPLGTYSQIRCCKAIWNNSTSVWLCHQLGKLLCSFVSFCFQFSEMAYNLCFMITYLHDFKVKLRNIYSYSYFLYLCAMISYIFLEA